jgi:hypothetical protein
MIYRVVTYNKATERLTGNLPVPPSVLAEIKRIAGFPPDHDALGEYPLDEDQTRRITSILGFRPDLERFYYYVEPYEPPEVDGFQQAEDAAA